MADAKLTFMKENAQIIFRNFSGAENMYNAKGSRNFAVVLTQDEAEAMYKEGWNVKFPKEREDDEEDMERDAYISVEVSYKYRPPRIVMMTSKARTEVGEDSVEVLDWADIAQVDLICNASHWTVGDKSGIKAYLKSMFVTINEDYLELKYAVNPVDGSRNND